MHFERRPAPLPVTGALLVVVIVTTVMAAACVRRPVHGPDGRLTPHGTTIRVQRASGDTVTLPLETYVRGAILTEMPLGTLPAAAAATAAEVQAILARTYAVHHRGRHRADGFDVCSTTHCQVYREVESVPPALRRIVETAVARTRGLVVTYHDRPIEALFHADCGGATSSATSVWGGPAPPYLQGVRDRYCVTVSRAPWSVRIARDELREALNGDPRTAVGARLDAVTVARRDAGGRVVSVLLDGSRRRHVRGEVLRAVLAGRFGWQRIRSARFSIERAGNHFTLVGTGFGHGAGLCQVGAMARARAGHSSRRILADYYPGTHLDALPAARPPSREARRLP